MVPINTGVYMCVVCSLSKLFASGYIYKNKMGTLLREDERAREDECVWKQGHSPIYNWVIIEASRSETVIITLAPSTGPHRTLIIKSATLGI